MVRAGLQRENSLVCLQTGAGKTFVRIYNKHFRNYVISFFQIAGIVAKFFYILSHQKQVNNLQKPPSATSLNTSRRFKAVFLVPIKALVDQQCAAFKQVFIDRPESILKTIDNQTGERYTNKPKFMKTIFYFL